MGFLLICLAVLSYTKKWLEDASFLIGCFGAILLLMGCMSILDKESPTHPTALKAEAEVKAEK
jgi:hypothetical protein